MRDATRKRLPRKTAFETCEPRHLMSAEPLAELQVEYLAAGQTAEPLGTLASAHAMTGVTDVRNEYGFTGIGQTVAIIDSGIGYDHPALGGGLGREYRVVGGWDFAENDANPYDDGTAGSHGTHVAGIVGSSSSLHSGVAPGVDLVALRVFNDAGQGNFAWIEKSLQWVHQNRLAFENPITAVNLSIGSTWNSTEVPNWSTLEDEFVQLRADGIFISVAAGNSFALYNTPGLSYPGASPSVVPVASVDDNGLLSSFSQRDDRVLAAPGRGITSTVPDYRGNKNGKADDFLNFSGTSMASPYVAGASVIVRQAMEFLGRTGIDQDDIYALLRNTADTIHDTITNHDYLRLNLERALASLMPADDIGSDAAGANKLGTIVDTRAISGAIGKLTDRDYFQFVAGQTGQITITANSPQGLRPTWELVGGAGRVSGNSGETFAIDVIAGQTYTFGIGTQSGIGNYRLAFGSESTGANLFDEGFYLRNNPDVRAAVEAGYFADGFSHYLRHGQKEGRSPSALFDEAWYLARNADVRAAIVRGYFRSGFDHYTQFGQFERRNPSSLFDSRTYLSRNPDVAAAIARGEFASAADHFQRVGQFTGRSPSAAFSHTYYINRYLDVRSALRSGQFASSFEHFVRVGRAEGRIGASTATFKSPPATASATQGSVAAASLAFETTDLLGPGDGPVDEATVLADMLRGSVVLQSTTLDPSPSPVASTLFNEFADAHASVEATLAGGMVKRWLEASLHEESDNDVEDHFSHEDHAADLAQVARAADRDLLAEIDSLFALLAS